MCTGPFVSVSGVHFESRHSSSSSLSPSMYRIERLDLIQSLYFSVQYLVGILLRKGKTDSCLNTTVTAVAVEDVRVCLAKDIA